MKLTEPGSHPAEVADVPPWIGEATDGCVASTVGALTVVMPASSSGSIPERRSTAVFLAHLIAAKDQHPQARARRRADPAEVSAAYRRIDALEIPTASSIRGHL